PEPSHGGTSVASPVQEFPAPGPSSAVVSPMQNMAALGRRFKPPTVTRPTLPAPATPSTASTSTLPAVSPVPAVPLWYLNFPPVSQPVPPIAQISLPPSLAARKTVPGLSIVLSALPVAERRQAALVCKVFRYAVYQSAHRLLQRYYGGIRLQALLDASKVPVEMMNLWPYLRQREAEARTRKAAVNTSLLGMMYRGSYPLAERLWASPDHERQLTIAVRFLLTRVWFALSVGSARGDPFEWLRDVVVDAQETVPGEVWTVSVRGAASGDVEHFHVLEATCEPIGRLPPANPSDLELFGFDPNVHPLRADWAAYISDHGTASLPKSLRWAHQAEYERGISRHWRKRMDDMRKGEGADLAVALLDTAERYVLACVVGNSLSGQWMSATQMSQMFAGLGTPTISPLDRPPSMTMYLPGHHHVESVHFTAAGGMPLHPALAVVQTLSRSYYILRDNGMQVGCEEDGVGELWMKILGCTDKGV
ncbi:hypothetical protein BV25DRAFT_1767857, partial [Artomyces pyxidatus]